MGILDILNGGSTPPAATPPIVATPNAAPNYNEFYQRLINAAVANGRAHPSSLFNWLSGRGTDAARAEAEAAAPGAWQQLQTGQSGMQNAQLGTAQNIASTSALSGVPIDPNNIPAATQDLAKAYSGVFGANGGAPAGGAGATNPVEAQRAFYMRMGRFMQMQGQAPMAKEFFALANAGVPDKTFVTQDVVVRDPVLGSTIGVDAGTLAANRAGQTSEAEAVPTRKTAAFQAGLDRQTHSINVDTDAAHAIRMGIDTRTGQPVTTTDAALLHGGAQNFADKNPFFEGQQGELKTLREGAESADSGLNLASQVVNSANGLFTGKGAGTLQEARKLALAAGELTGAKVSDNVLNDASQFEQLKFAAQQLVAKASHDLSPRIAQNIYQQINNVKPGDMTSVRGLRDIIVNQIVPTLSRSRSLYKGASTYYKNNPFKNDAMTVVPGQLPLDKFSVKSVHDAQPGDFFLDPATGNLRQRPE